MNDSRSRFLTQLILPFGVGVVAALLHRWGATAEWPVGSATEPAPAMLFGALCGLVLLGIRKKRAPRRHHGSEQAPER
ncbi:hypothetical protein [Actinopolyspora saharensis]|uniref:hypothetical protein n=1 Tax=Actinopolyspora saharensis TaxID=995062 RepID=UPI003F6788F8